MDRNQSFALLPKGLSLLTYPPPDVIEKKPAVVALFGTFFCLKPQKPPVFCQDTILWTIIICTYIFCTQYYNEKPPFSNFWKWVVYSQPAYERATQA